MAHDWGWKQAQKDAAGMGFGKEPTRVAVKPHTRAPRMAVGGPVTPVKAVHKHESHMHKGETPTKFADGGPVKKWIAGAINPAHKGLLHKELGVPQGKKIPAKKLSAATSQPGAVGKRARLAKTLGSFKK